MAQLFKVNGVKYYPVCSKERNAHKIEYWYNKALIACYDSDFQDEKALEERDEAEKMLDYFMFYCQNDGLVYAPYKDGQRIKEMIVCYDLRH